MTSTQSSISTSGKKEDLKSIVKVIKWVFHNYVISLRLFLIEDDHVIVEI